MKRLIIVGNGFDLHHRMKTQYKHYRDYLISIGETDIVKCFEGNGEFEPEYLWSRLEEVVGSLNYEDAYCFLTSYSSDDWKDSAHHDFQYEVEKMTHYWPALKDNLVGWIRQIEYTKADDSLRELLRDTNSFLSFNYTNTLEVLYGISKSDITYIHGASVTDDLVLGHRGDSWYPEWDPNNPDEDIRLLEASSIMDDHFEDTRKQIESIIQQHKSFFEGCSEYDEIYLIGLSYNETDRMYIKEIARCNEKARWYFNWYSKEDFDYIDKYTESLGIRSCQYNTLVLKLNKNVGGESYQKLLKVGDKEKLQLKFYLNDAQHVSRISFGLQYVDSMTNEYIQIYTVNCKNHIGFISVDDLKELITIENGYPQFLGQVHHLGE